MSDEPILRRTALKLVGGGLAAAGLTGTVTAQSNNQYLVGADTSEAVREARNRADAVSRVFDFGDIGHVVSARFADQAVEQLEKRRDVRYVEPEGEVQAHHHGRGAHGRDDDDDDQTVPWGIERVDAITAHDANETGDGSNVAIIDTGIDATHEDLADVLGNGFAATSCNGGGCEEDWDDDNGHGTHVAGTVGAIDNDLGVVGVSPDTTLHAAKALDEDGSGTLTDVIACIEWSADESHDVINMSLGASEESSALKEACEYAQEQGCLVIASAGNTSGGDVEYPAAYESVVAVSATDDSDRIARYSAVGEEVDIAAPGTDVLSTIPGDDYGEYSGTSMAAPHVAGGAALLMVNGYTATEARYQLLDTAEDIGLDDDEQGDGLLDVKAALALDEEEEEEDDGEEEEEEEEDEEVPPEIDSFDAEQQPNNNPHADIDVSWAVSDDNGDLDTVNTEVLEGSQVVESTTTDVSGESASGSDELRVHRGDGGSYEVRLTVIDEAANTTSETMDV